MRLQVIRKLVNHLGDTQKTLEFMKVVELRQRMYRELKSSVLILDSIDLIADHLLLYSETDGRLMCYLRAVTARTCAEYGLELPISSLMKENPSYRDGYRRFCAESLEPMQIFYLCLDPAYRPELKGLKAVELLTWLALKVSGISPDRAAFACTINNRYRQDPVMHLLGNWVGPLPDMDHPVIPDKHRFVLVPKIRAEYWEEERKKFAGLYTSLSDGGVDLLAEPAEIGSDERAA